MPCDVDDGTVYLPGTPISDVLLRLQALMHARGLPHLPTGRHFAP